MRAIDADALKNAFEEDGHMSGYIEEFIDDMPTLDIAPVAEHTRMRRALAMMWYAYRNKDEENPHGYEREAVEEAERLLGNWEVCMTELLKEE